MTTKELITEFILSLDTDYSEIVVKTYSLSGSIIFVEYDRKERHPFGWQIENRLEWDYDKEIQLDLLDYITFLTS